MAHVQLMFSYQLFNLVNTLDLVSPHEHQQTKKE